MAARAVTIQSCSTLRNCTLVLSLQKLAFSEIATPTLPSIRESGSTSRDAWPWTHLAGHIRVILGLFRDSGKKMETTTMGYIGIYREA